jgi:hypothetical protein
MFQSTVLGAIDSGPKERQNMIAAEACGRLAQLMVDRTQRREIETE